MNTELTMEELLKRPLSQSSLKEFLRSPLHFMYYRQARREATPAMIMGGLVDVLLLTPDEYDVRYVVIPENAPRKPSSAQVNAKNPSEATVEAIAWWEKFYKEHGRKTIITAEMLAEAQAMKAAVYAHEDAMYYLNQVHDSQLDLWWTDKATGLPMRAILDGFGEIILSLKTAADGDPGDFIKTAFQYNYHLQTAAELEAVRYKRGAFPDVYYLVIEMGEPYGVSVLKADKNFIALGKKKLEHTLKEFKMCMDQGRFGEGYEFRARTLERKYHHLELPPWALKELAE